MWQQLEKTPGWEVLKAKFYASTVVNVKPTSIDGREAFYFEAIRSQAFRELIEYPENQIKERFKYQ